MTSAAAERPEPIRAALVQYGEFLFLKKLRESNIRFVLVGSTAAFTYGMDVEPKDVDCVVEYQREVWDLIFKLADEVEPQPGGPFSLTREPVSFPTHVRVPLGRGLDLLSGFRHASFHEIVPRTQHAEVRVELMDDLSLIVSIADMKDLLASWKDRGEPRDSQMIRAAQKFTSSDGVVVDS